MNAIKRNVKKVSGALLIACLAALMMAAAPGRAQELDTTLYDRGMEMISQLKQMAQSDEYIRLYTENQDIIDAIQSAGAGDFDQIEAVYQITLSNFDKIIQEMLGSETLPEGAYAYAADKILMAIPSQINAQGGSTALAASVACTVDELFVYDGLEQSVIYLYVFKDAVPVAVSFRKGEDGAAAAAASYILNPDYEAYMTSADNPFAQAASACKIWP